MAARGRTRDRNNRFTLLDGLVLIAATALGLGGTRVLFHRWFLSSPIEPLSPGDFFAVLAIELEPFLPIPAAWTLGLAVLGLLRTPLRKAVRSPGVAACLAGSFVVLLIPVNFAFLLVVSLFRDYGGSMARLLDNYPPSTWPVRCLGSLSRDAQHVAVAGLVAWGLVALGRRRLRPRGWIEWAGTALLALWLLLGLLFSMFGRAIH